MDSQGFDEIDSLPKTKLSKPNFWNNLFCISPVCVVLFIEFIDLCIRGYYCCRSSRYTYMYIYTYICIYVYV
jgi:hypothetical protein